MRDFVLHGTTGASAGASCSDRSLDGPAPRAGIEYDDRVGTFTVDHRFATAPQYVLPYFLTRVWVWIGAAIFMITVVTPAPEDQDDRFDSN